jgi:hypothetical protein
LADLPIVAERAMALIEEGVDLVVVDTAHGHSQGVLEMVRKLKADSAAAKVDIVGGNVAALERMRGTEEWQTYLKNNSWEDSFLAGAAFEQFLADGITHMFGNPGTVEQGFLDALGVPLHSPAFLFERTTRSQTGEIVEFVRSIYRGDRYRLVTELNRRERGGATPVLQPRDGRGARCSAGFDGGPTGPRGPSYVARRLPPAPPAQQGAYRPVTVRLPVPPARPEKPQFAHALPVPRPLIR